MPDDLLGALSVNKANTDCQVQIGTCHGHLPSPSTRIKSCTGAAAYLQHLLKGVQAGEQK